MSKASFSHFVANGVFPGQKPIVELSISPAFIHLDAEMRTCSYLTPEGARDVADLLYRAAAAAEDKVAAKMPDPMAVILNNRKQNG
jgi:hypothetical protein